MPDDTKVYPLWYSTAYLEIDIGIKKTFIIYVPSSKPSYPQAQTLPIIHVNVDEGLLGTLCLKFHG